MKRILTAAAIVAMAAFAAAPALAATTATTPMTKTSMMKAKPAMATPAKPRVVTFKQIDANHDGKISFAELKAFWPTLTKAEFAKYDANKDGFYNHAELAAFAKAHMPAKPTK